MLAEAPLLLRATGGDGDALTIHLVGGAAGPLGGDCIQLELDVAADATLIVRSVAASMAQPGPGAQSSGSTATISTTLSAGAALDWWPEPLVSVASSRHTMHTDLAVAGGAHARWVDEVVLGRHGEPSGALVMNQRVTVDGHPVLSHQVAFGPSLRSAGRHGNGSVAITGIEVGVPAYKPMSMVEGSLRVARFPLSLTATAWIGLGDDLDVVRSALSALDLTRSNNWHGHLRL